MAHTITIGTDLTSVPPWHIVHSLWKSGNQGRPAMPRKSDIVRLNLRLTRDLYDRLVASTQKHGTSLQTEVINRIEQTYGDVRAHVLKVIKNAVEIALAGTGAKVHSIELAEVRELDREIEQQGPAQASPLARSKSPVVKHSIVIAGHKTSVSLEDDFWR